MAFTTNSYAGMDMYSSATIKSPYNPMGGPVDFEGKSPYSPMTIPVDFNSLEGQTTMFDLEIGEASRTLEPESEFSPHSQVVGAGKGGIIPSFASTVSDIDYPEYTKPVGHGMVSRGPRETASWNSNGTDFDNLTSPGAQAEKSGVYCNAAFGGHMGVQTFQPPSSFTTPLPTLLPTTYVSSSFQSAPASMPSASVGAHGWINQNGMKAADALQSQAAELERAAEQLMAAALQAKAAASQMNAQGAQVPCVNSSVSQMDVQKPKWSLWGSLAKGKSVRQPAQTEKTTVMLRNLPNDYTREMLLQLLNSHGFAGHYDFVYLPTDFKRRAGLGYSFVNMTSPAAAERVFATMHGFSGWQYASSKVLEVSWSEPLQGLEGHIDRYRNSPVMHPDVPEAFRPLLFQGGVLAPFPQPTKKIQKPRMKASTNDA